MNTVVKVMGGVVLSEAVRGYVRYRWRSLKRDVARPWRDGKKGAAADLGRWLGLSLALGAKAFGTGAAVYIFMKRR